MSKACTTCPVCDCGETVSVSQRDAVPVHQNQVFTDAPTARAAVRGTLAMRCCTACGFVFNSAFDESLLSYDQTYDNRQSCSPSFVAHMDDRVRRVMDSGKPHDGCVVEIGCGKGEFIRGLVDAAAPGSTSGRAGVSGGGGVTGIGFDPTYDGPATLCDGRLRFERRFFDRAAAREVQPSVVVCRHVIEHIAAPVAFLRQVRAAIGDRADVKVFFETPCAQWILNKQVIWDLFYEHCSLFTATSLTAAFEAAGFEVLDVMHVFDGQYLWIEAGVDAARDDGGNFDGGSRLARSLTPGLSHGARGAAFAAAEGRLVSRWRDAVCGLARRGRVAVWGAGAKGVTFVNLVDPGGEMIACIVDVNPNKQGRYLAGSGHRIVAPDALGAEAIDAAIVLNPNYHAEVRQTVASLGLNVRVIDLMNEAAESS